MKRITAMFMAALLLMNINVYAEDIPQPLYGIRTKFNSASEKIEKEAGVTDEVISSSALEPLAAEAVTYISTADDLKRINGSDGGYYQLRGDIDLKGEEWTPISITNAVFLGMDYSIKGLRLTKCTDGKAALFSDISGTSIANLSLEGVDINISTAAADEEYYISAIAAKAESGEIINCHVNGSINVNVTSAAENSNVHVYGISNGIGCTSDIDIKAEFTGGGDVCGLYQCESSGGKGDIHLTDNNEYITNCLVSAEHMCTSSVYRGDISLIGKTVRNGHGFYTTAAGITNSEDCCYIGDISGNSEQEGITLVGIENSKNSYMTGNIDGKAMWELYINGISRCEDCYAEGNIYAENPGGYRDGNLYSDGYVYGINHSSNCMRTGNMNVYGILLSPLSDGLDFCGISYSDNCYNIGDIHAEGDSYSIYSCAVDSGSGNCFVGNIEISEGSYYGSSYRTCSEGNFFNGTITVHGFGQTISVSESNRTLYVFDCYLNGIWYSDREYSVCPYSPYDGPFHHDSGIVIYHGPAGYPGAPEADYEPITFSLCVLDQDTEVPVENAVVDIDGEEYVTDDEGIVTASTDAPYVSEINIKANDEVIETINDYVPVKDNISDIYVETFDMDIEDINMGSSDSVDVKGPSVKLGSEEFSLFSLPFGFNKTIIKGLKIAYDKDKKTYQVIFGSSKLYNSKKIGDAQDEEWKKEYNIIKKAVITDYRDNSDSIFEYEKANVGFEGSAAACGFMEFTKDENGKIVLKDNGLVVALSAEAETEVRIPPAPWAYLRFAISGEVGADAKFKLEKIELKKPKVTAQANASLVVTPTLGIGAGKRKVLSAEAGLEGELEGNLSMPVVSMPESAEVILRAKAYVELTVLAFGLKYSKTFTEAQLYPDISPMTIANIDDASTFELITRNYIPDIMPIAENKDIFKSVVYPYTDVSLSRFSDGREIMIWTDDDTSRNLVNKTALYYAVNTDGVWSEPKQIYNDGTPDFKFSVSQYDDSIGLAWQNGNITFDENADIDKIAANTDIYYCEFNGTSWSKPINASKGSDYEYSPVVYKISNSASIGWIQNTENSVIDNGEASTETIYGTKYYNGEMSEPDALSDSHGIINEFAFGNYGIYYIYEDNGVFKMRDQYYDRDIPLSGGRPSGLMNCRDGKIYYNCDGSLYSLDYMSSFAVGRTFEWEKMKYIYDADSPVILGEVQNDLTSELYVSRNINGFWSSPVKITEFGKKIRSWDGAVDGSGNIHISALLADIAIGDGSEALNDTAQLAYTDYTFKDDISLVSAEFSKNPERGGKTALKLSVLNNSSQEQCMPEITVSGDKAGVLYKDVYSNSCILPGNTEEMTIDIPIPDDFVRQNITVSATADNVSEENKENNSITFEVGEGSLEIEAKKGSSDLSAVVILKNTGCDKVENVELNVTDERGRSLLAKTVGTAAPGTEQRFEIALSPDFGVFSGVHDYHSVIAEASYGENGLSVSDSFRFTPQLIELISSKESKVFLSAGDTYSPEIKTYPENVISDKIHVSNSSPQTVNIEADGSYTALAKGNATIAYMPAGTKYSHRIRVFVTDKGDVTGDGIVDSADAAAILKYSGGIEKFSESRIHIGDYNNDGSTDLKDAIDILKNTDGQ